MTFIALHHTPWSLIWEKRDHGARSEVDETFSWKRGALTSLDGVIPKTHDE